MDIFPVRVRTVTDLTPNMRRFTVTGESLERYGDPGYDQRIKVVFPNSSGSLESMPTGPDWYSTWRELDPETRPPFRTYTTRAVRREALEVDVDMVVHDVRGPASRWIRDAVVGDDLMIVATSVDDEPPHLGIDFVPPAEVGHYLLVGDETAAPAIAVILEQLPADARGAVIVELPEDDDASYLPNHPGFTRYIAGVATARGTLTWSARCARFSRICARPAAAARSRKWTSTRTCCGRCPAHGREVPLSSPPPCTRGWRARRVSSSPCAGFWSPSTEWTGAPWPSWDIGVWGAPRATDTRGGSFLSPAEAARLLAIAAKLERKVT